MTGRQWVLLLVPALLAAAPRVDFTPMEARFAGAAQEYDRIWSSEGRRIAAALEEVSGLEFGDAPIEVIVSNVRPVTLYGGRSIRLRPGYSPRYKRAVLVHELGHALVMMRMRRRPADLDDHRLLYLFLYDVWTDLYSQAFADRMVGIERRIPGPYDYDSAWAWALAMTREQRQERLRRVRRMQ